MKNLSLRVKLLGGFLLTAAITLIVGALAYVQLTSLASKSSEITTLDLPGVQESLTIKAELSAAGQALRTLMSSEVARDARVRQYKNIEAARAKYSAAVEAYSKHDVSPEAKALFQDLKARLDASRVANNKALELAKHFDEADILKPDELMGDLQQFRGDHYRLEAQLLELILNGTKFEGGEDHTACNFGKWLATFKTSNAAVNDSLRAIQESHARFHQSAAEIKKLVAGGGGGKARAMLAEVTKPSAEKVFDEFRKMTGVARTSQEQLGALVGILFGESREAMNAALAAAEALSAYHKKGAEQASADLSVSAALSKAVALAGMVLGVLIAVILGLVLTHSITRPVMQGVAFAKAMAEGDFTKTLDINQKDEIGVLASALNDMVLRLRQVVADVRGATDNVASGSE